MAPIASLLPIALVIGTAHVSAAPHTKRDWYPTVKSYQQVGNIANPDLNRDSCASSKVGDRMLWTCRDTQTIDPNTEQQGGTVWSSSAAWTNLDSNYNPELFMYSEEGETPFYPYASDECSDSTDGDCGDGTRYALWPNQPPLVTSVDGSIVTAYTWIPKTHISGLTPVSGQEDPATTLYKFVYDSSDTDRNAVPSPTIVNEAWWWGNTIPFGSYGSVVKDGYAYLFGQPSNKDICLAKVPTDNIEDYSQWQYYVNGTWTSQLPLLADSQYCNIENVSAGGQGTYYFSHYWNKWVWIGQPGVSVSAYFMVTTADNIEGPWASPVFFYQGQDGTFDLGAYTLQAHPGMSESGVSDTNSIYISYTKSDTDAQVYTTPLILINWN